MLEGAASLSTYGKYRAIAKLGQGGMADVHLAVVRGPAAFNKLVVIKRHRGIGEGNAELAMFLDEAKLAARLSHTNIVQTYEIGHDDDGYFIVMEYLEGQALNRVLKAVNRGDRGAEVFTCPVWAKILADVLAGLHHAHELHDYDGTPLAIVHRDISSHNIFVTYDGVAKIVDFGIAKAALNTTRTETGMLKGKVAYMAPEQAVGSRTVDRRADVFIVGLVLWEMLAHKRLFQGNAPDTIRRLLAGDLPRVSTVVPGVPRVLDDIVAKALQHEPDARFQTAAEMRRALDGYLRTCGEDVEAESIGLGMQALFAVRRAKLQRQIQEQIEQVSVAGSKTDSITPIGLSPRTLAAGLPTLDSGSSHEHHGTGSESSLRVVAAAPAPSRRGVVLGGAVAGVVLVAVASLAFGSFLTRAPVPVATASQSASPAPAGAVQTAGMVEITSVPAEATVIWEGKPVGTTPLKLDLAPGLQTVVVSKPGFADQSLAVMVAPGASVTRQAELQPKESASAAIPAPEPPTRAAATARSRPEPSPPRGPVDPTATATKPEPPAVAPPSKPRVVDDPKVVE